jgi:hypothetical protein
MIELWSLAALEVPCILLLSQQLRNVPVGTISPPVSRIFDCLCTTVGIS